MRKRIFCSVIVAAMTVSLSGCEWEFGTVGEDEEGQLSLDLADAPVDDLTGVNITVTGVELKPSDGDSVNVTYDDPRAIDLLDLQNGNTEALLSNEDVPAGSYAWVRLKLSTLGGAHDVVGRNGGTYSLVVPSGSRSGLQVNSGFSVDEDDSVALTLDFDVRKSVVASGSVQADYFLKPVLRLVENDNVGTISGTVNESTIIAARCADVQTYTGLVYVYEGASVEPDDLGSGTEPVTAVPVTDADDPGTYTYKATLLNEGDYTVSYSCDVDDNQRDESLSFVDPESVAVDARENRELNLD